jgi:F-type H+-transporting ATPase subunit b
MKLRRSIKDVALLALPAFIFYFTMPVMGQEKVQEKTGAVAAAAEGHEGAHAEKTTEQILSQTAWAILSIVVVLAILLKKLFPPIVQAMDKRAADIRDALSAAEKARAEAQEMMAKHEESLELARKEAAAIIEEGKADAVKVKDSIVASAKKDSEEIAGRAKREIEQAKVNAMDELTRRSIQLSLEISSRLIRKNLNEAEQQGLIQETIRGLPAA